MERLQWRVSGGAPGPHSQLRVPASRTGHGARRNGWPVPPGADCDHTCCSGAGAGRAGSRRAPAAPASVLSFRALRPALLHATYLSSLRLASLAPTTFPTSVMHIGGLPRFSNIHLSGTPYLRNVRTSTLNTPETLHVHRLDNLLKQPEDSLAAGMACTLSLPTCPGEVRLPGTHLL